MITLNNIIKIVLLITVFSFGFQPIQADFHRTLCSVSDQSDEVVWGYMISLKDSIIGDYIPENILLEESHIFADSIKSRYLKLAKERKKYHVVYSMKVIKIYDKEKMIWKKAPKNDIREIHAFVEEGFFWDGRNIFLTQHERKYMDNKKRLFFFYYWTNGLVVGGDYSDPIEEKDLESISCVEQRKLVNNQINSMYSEQLKVEPY